MAAAKKVSKNSTASTRQKEKGKMVGSSECDKCSCKCENGKKYIVALASGKTGKGVYCRK